MGILKGRLDRLLREKAHRPYFPHNTSHWLGLDVHDIGPVSSADRSPKLVPGVVMTVEPGIYFLPRDRSVPREFRGIGVRIEDDVLITKKGAEVLTSAPKDLLEL